MFSKWRLKQSLEVSCFLLGTDRPVFKLCQNKARPSFEVVLTPSEFLSHAGCGLRWKGCEVGLSARRESSPGRRGLRAR
jgi:hypothetical protein